MAMLFGFLSYALVVLGVIGGTVLGYQTLLASPRAVEEPPPPKITTERKTLPPKLKMKPDAKPEISAAAREPAYSAAAERARVRAMYGKEHTPEKKKTVHKQAPKIGKEALEAFAYEPPASPRSYTPEVGAF